MQIADTNTTATDEEPLLKHNRIAPTPLAAQLMAAGLLAAALPSYAQTAAPTPATAASSAAPSAPPSAAPERTDKQFQEVVVTAQKVRQLASKTPVALTAVSGEDLKSSGIVDIRGVTEVVPNVQISQESGRNMINIRGVMAVDTTERGDPSNAFHIDGVYIGRPEAQLGAFFDLERVEVLRGPQGTLYGKNATGGAINVITNKPAFKREGRAAIDIGNYGALRTEGMLNEKLSDSVALRAAFTTQHRNTYLKAGDQKEPSENQDDTSIRLSTLWKITPATSLLVTGERATQGGAGFTPLPIRNFYDGAGVGSNFTEALPDNIRNPIYVDRGTDAALTLGGGVPWLRKTHKNNAFTALRMEANHDFGFAALTYQFGHLKSDLEFDIAGPAAAATVSGGGVIGITTMPSSQTSHELRLTSAQTGSLRWVAGLYQMDEKIKLNRQFLIDPPDTNAPLLNVLFDNTVKNKASAAFGQMTYSLLPQTRVTLGLRASHDTKSLDSVKPGTPGVREASFSKNTYRLGIEQDLPGNLMAYANYSTGYKAGGFNDANSSSPIIRPESLTAIEGGIKGRLFSDALQFSLGAYHYDYKDMQVRGVYCITPISCGATMTINGEGATIQGLEFEGRWRASPRDVVNFAIGYNDAKYDRFQSRDSAGNVTWDVSGQALDRAPKGTALVGYAHDFTLPGGGNLRAGISTKYTTAYFNSSYSATAVYRYPQKAFTRSDLLLTYTPAVGDWTAQFYVKNLEDKVQVVNVMQGAVNATAPRTFGVRWSTDF